MSPKSTKEMPFGTMLTAMVTPFKPNLEIDFDQAAALAVDLVKLGVSGVRPVLAALLLGVYDPNSDERVGAGATPSFIGIWVKTVANVNSLSVVNSKLILRIPTAQIALFEGKTAMVQLFYSTAAGE